MRDGEEPLGVQACLPEARFRTANAEIRIIAAGLDDIFQRVPFVCECANRDCTKILRVQLYEYDRVREHPTRFLYAPGHEAGVPDTVPVETLGDVLIIRKTGAAATLARATDPRHQPTARTIGDGSAMEERTRRVGINEAVFRELNEQLAELAEDERKLDCVCECGQISCLDTITVTLAEYRALRADATTFAIKHGHAYEDVEDVVSENDRVQAYARSPASPPTSPRRRHRANCTPACLARAVPTAAGSQL
jgi:hypothetical protein